MRNAFAFRIFLYMIEEIILRHGTRGMNTVATCLPKNYCSLAAQDLCRAKKGNILILTGFTVNSKGETDGPIGSYFLSAALLQLGFTPYIVTDKWSLPYFKDKTSCILYDTHSSADAILQFYRPEAIISIERCGRSHDGKYYNMLKKDISDFTPPIDDLVLKSNVLTIGIGDGGNEIGMGNVKTYVQELDIIPCIIPCNHLIVSTTSNWGAYGLITALEHLSHIPLLPTRQAWMEYFKYIVRMGAVDGISGTNTLKVDGMDYMTECDILEQLRLLSEKSSLLPR